MRISLIGANIVLLAKNHNPSIVSKEWLLQKGVLTESAKSFTHTPAFSVVETDNFSFIVDPDRLQLTVVKDIEKNVSALPDKILSYVQALPETPYYSIGFNFGYDIESDKSILQKIYCPNNDLKSLFSEEYKLGGIVEYKFNEFVVKLFIQPDVDGNMKADFNFHYQLGTDSNIEHILKMHSETLLVSKKNLEGLIDE